VDDRLSAAHAELSASGGIPKDQAGEQFGADIVAELLELDLAHVVPHTPAGPATFRAARPDMALMGMLARLQIQVIKDHQKILLCVQRLRELLAGPAAGDDQDPRNLARIITSKEEICQLSIDLMSSATHDWMTMENTDTDMPITEDFAIPIQAQRRDSVRFRAIYDHAALAHPVMAQLIEQAIAQGQEARVIKTVTMKLLLAETVALMPLTPTGSGGALLIRGSGVPVLHMLRDYYEMTWAAATRIGAAEPPPDCPLTADQRKVLRLLAEGLTDMAIANRIGRDQSTVRRHITAIMNDLNVPSKSRFVAGAVAHQRGWLPDSLGTHHK
jgi:DNA-binding NarL/FixJ family response regulator